jgi:rhodanese-related sulfurtransferase
MMMWDQLAESAAGPEVVADTSESAEPVSRPAAETALKPEAKPELASQVKTAPRPSPEETTAAVSPRAAANTSKATTASAAEPEPTAEKPSITPPAATPVTDQAQVEINEASESRRPTQQSAPAAAPPPVTAPVTAPVKPKRPGEWIRKMHHIMAFKNLPPANVKALLEKMERIPLEAGDTVVKQGETGDYYYVLVDGKAGVTRTVELATLNAGASFGEESLVSGTERNATVTMKTPGAVMRLSKNDFNELLREPMLNRISPEEARSQVLMGAVWLDVRHAREYQHGHFRGAISIPLHELRMRIDEMDRNVHYICCCRTGTRSSAAAFILVQNGYNASVLTGGIQVMPQDLKKDPAFTSK